MNNETIKNGYELVGDYCFPQFYDAGVCPTQIEAAAPEAYSDYCEYVQTRDMDSMAS